MEIENVEDNLITPEFGSRPEKKTPEAETPEMTARIEKAAENLETPPHVKALEQRAASHRNSADFRRAA